MSDAAAAAAAGVIAEPEKTHAAGEFKLEVPLLSCRFDPSGKAVFASSQDNLITRWQLADGKATTLAGHDSWVRALAFHPSGSHLYSGGYDGNLILWEATAEAPQPLVSMPAHDGWVRAIAVHPAGSQLATCGNDHRVKLWTPEGQLVNVLEGHTCHVYSVIYHPDGRRVISGDLKGGMREWDVETGEQLRSFDGATLWKYDPGFQADIGGVRGIDVSADGKHLVGSGITEVSNAFAGIGEPLVVAVDLDSGATATQHVHSKKIKGTIWNVRLHPAGFVLGGCGGNDGGHLLFWKLGAAQEYFGFKLPSACRDMHVHPDTLRVCTSHDDGRVCIWKMAAK